MQNTLNKIFSRHALTNFARIASIAAACVTMSALTFAKPPTAPPITAPATQSNAVVAPIVATQFPPSFEPVLEINLNPKLASELAPELAPVLAPQLASEQKEQPSQSNQSSLVSASCVGDLNHDGKIDSADLGFLLTAYGPCLGCEEDLYADGNVNSADLGVLLIQFGVCPAPTVTAISPASGLTSGGTTITLNGTNFFGASSVTVGGTLATSVNVVSATVLTAVTPAGSVGSTVSVSVTTPGGTGTLASAFSYYEAGTFAWATVLEALPNAAVVPDSTVRAKIIASGYPWRVLDTGTGIEMLLIPSGTFTMGCSASNSYGCYSIESPNHQVTLSKAFYLGKTEVTQAQWQAKMGSNPSWFSNNANKPVEQVSWNDIASFNTATGLRLPSEAEWEYACRGGTTTAFHSMPGYPNGTNDDSLLENIAWYGRNSGSTTHDVAGKAANAFGMYDMSGNVWEWCSDWLGDTYYSTSPSTDPAGPSTGTVRVLRGGQWLSYSDSCRSSNRDGYPPDSRNFVVGIRVARTPDFTPAPTVTAISPASGLPSGGTNITLNGTHFFGASSVTVGGVAATSVNVVSASVLTAVTPAGSIGSAVSVSVTTPGGTGTLNSAFSYSEVSTLSWATVLEQAPIAAVVPDATVRANIVASGYPWRVRDNSSGIEMLLIPSGTFTMGCSASNSCGCNSLENPTHQVTLSKAFYLGKTEVTQAQWQAKMSSNPSNFKNYSDSPSRPVEQVSWNDIAGFNTVTGLRLPSEAEWEYACRGNTTTAFHSMPGYPNGTNDDSLVVNIAWCQYNSLSSATDAVAGKAANAFGMYDMSGNVFEWCNDWYGSYAAGNATDPAGPSSGSARVARGGDFLSYSDSCRSSTRTTFGPDDRRFIVGFRVAKTP